MILNHEGQRYEITNWDEFKRKLLSAIGFQVESEIVKQINALRLVDTGEYKRGVHSEVQKGELIITNTAPYAIYLEYGTYEYWQRFKTGSFPQTAHPKKKDLPRKERHKLPKGMQPFAVYRRILWNQNKMSRIINRAVKAASK
ncbi:MAG: hypothetical protein Unbinned1693contig1002_50 [Prokaryotic dsDNA virus sp.]|nr:MAG: hypothetical protein Unbinned1693contig1002_50 [Prokaryotic dsDNA virus sp.]